jgi:hypothetical protein
MNPYMRWVDSGKAFVCNFCAAHNPCPEAYFNYLGPDGRRRDVYERAELSCGTYEVGVGVWVGSEVGTGRGGQVPLGTTSGAVLRHLRGVWVCVWVVGRGGMSWCGARTTFRKR